MAKSTYQSHNLTPVQVDYMLLIDENELDIFTLVELKALTGETDEKINEVVENLVQKRVLSRIERGKYCRANFRDEKVIGCFLVEDGAIGYWSALNLHGLTEQFSNKYFIQTTKNKRDKSIFGVPYHFVTIPPAKRAGVRKQGYGNHTYFMTDVEKTLVDCFDLPQYSGGYPELIRALDQAHPVSKRLIEYSKAINNNAAIKRLGYLVEFMGKKGMKSFIQFARTRVTSTYNPLDPFGSDKGVHDKNWGLRLNITEEELTSILNKPY